MRSTARTAALVLFFAAGAAKVDPAPAPAGGHLLYIGNQGNNSITVYRDWSNGNAAPVRVIAGPSTGIDNPGQLSQDPQGNLYVANGSFYKRTKNAAILVFAPGANGDVAPIRVLAGPSTELHNITAMTVDREPGNLYVVEEAPLYLGNSNVLKFAPGAGGNQAPIARSAPALFPAIELSTDSTGHNLVEAHYADCCNSEGFGVSLVSKGFYNGGQPTTLAGTSYIGANGLADDRATKTYLITTFFGIERFAETTNGSGPANGFPARFTPPMVSVITSDTCGGQLALDDFRDVYVAHSARLGCPSDAVYVYRHDAFGHALPLRVISGPATQLDSPDGIYVGQ